MKDLLCLAADKNIEAALRGLLARPAALGMRNVEIDVRVHPHRDPGCFHEAPKFLQPFREQYRHALVVFDRAWEGAPVQEALVLERDLRQRLGGDQWSDVVVIDPELEVWVWSDSPHVDECLRWANRNPGLRLWLEQQALWPKESTKPPDPKAAMERALRAVHLPRSSAIYGHLARKVSIERCTDPSLKRLREVLGAWFPRDA